LYFPDLTSILSFSTPIYIQQKRNLPAMNFDLDK
jgi:hypothetical protein